MIEGYQDLPMSHQRYLVAQILANQELCQALAKITDQSYEVMVIGASIMAMEKVETMSDRSVAEVIEAFNRNAQKQEVNKLYEFLN